MYFQMCRFFFFFCHELGNKLVFCFSIFIYNFLKFYIFFTTKVFLTKKLNNLSRILFFFRLLLHIFTFIRKKMTAHVLHSPFEMMFRVHLDTVENWKLKPKTEKHCNKIIFKYVNSTVRPIFNEKVTEK